MAPVKKHKKKDFVDSSYEELIQKSRRIKMIINIVLTVVYIIYALVRLIMKTGADKLFHTIGSLSVLVSALILSVAVIAVNAIVYRKSRGLYVTENARSVIVILQRVIKLLFLITPILVIIQSANSVFEEIMRGFSIVLIIYSFVLIFYHTNRLAYRFTHKEKYAKLEARRLIKSEKYRKYLELYQMMLRDKMDDFDEDRVDENELKPVRYCDQSPPYRKHDTRLN